MKQRTMFATMVLATLLLAMTLAAGLGITLEVREQAGDRTCK